MQTIKDATMIDLGEFGSIIVTVYLIFHIPAFILLFGGIINYKENKELSKKQFIYAGVYFLIGAGICGSMF